MVAADGDRRRAAIDGEDEIEIRERLALVWLLPEGMSAPVRWLGYDLVPYRSDELARLFASAFAPGRTAAEVVDFCADSVALGRRALAAFASFGW